MATLPAERAPGLAPWNHDLDTSASALWIDYRVLPMFEELRRRGPVHHVSESPYGAYWSVVGHREIMEAEGKPDIFSSSWEHGGITIADRPEFNEDEPALPMFIAMDRPEHTGQRRAVAPAFSPAEMLRQQSLIRQRTREVLEALPLGEEFDWVQHVSIELTTGMLAILFDFPWEDRAKLTVWSDWMGDIESAIDPERNAVRWEKLNEAAGYFMNLWQQRIDAEPRPDLISMMAHAPATRDMPPQTFLGNLVLLIVGGNDTTRNSMSGAAMAQTRFPEAWERLMADPSLTTNATSELIRWQTPLAHMRRTTTCDTQLGGQAIAAGDKVVLWYLSANRDEALFDEADDFVPERSNARRHLAFGFGIHRCVGARLAELQLATLIDTLRELRVRVRVTGEPGRVSSSFVHGYRRLPVIVERA